MASQTFSFPSGTPIQTSASVTVASGEFCRVRFEPQAPINARLLLAITANSVTSYVEIDSRQAWVCHGVADGDSLAVRSEYSGDVAISGIIETF